MHAHFGQPAPQLDVRPLRPQLPLPPALALGASPSVGARGRPRTASLSCTLTLREPADGLLNAAWVDTMAAVTRAKRVPSTRLLLAAVIVAFFLLAQLAQVNTI